ncbi:putative aquaglyceroporin [Aspergillus ruber CBS 135680]|uniref:Putative MIP transporter n=1 Tax=Aspergillus ruber (strain CBS 135680) TaxID=1388766 RepID=A0A017SJ45_ASPRC|nr:putative MIP transporter [Aspergillus ruber CBS 135680]EYE96335.1 putative MIP transporter [Aspergillus ruber CBS 135680]
MTHDSQELQPNQGSSSGTAPQSTQDGQEQQQEEPGRDSKMFSLAGSQPPSRNQPVAYVDPEYTQYNPHYNEENREPVWSLAQPLPRVVRPGMRPESAIKEEDKEEQDKPSKDHQGPGPAAQEPPAEVPPTDEQEDRPEAKVARPDDRGFHNRWSKLRHFFRQELAEWIGTTVAITLGLCASQSTYTSNNQAGTYPSIALTWGAAYMIGIYVAGGISGGHLNPAITISMSVWRGFPLRKCLTYIVAQVLGGLTAGGLAYAIYHDQIVTAAATRKVPQNHSAALQGLLTFPKDNVQPATAFFTEFLATAVLVGSIMALGDDANAPPGAGMQAFIIAILISAIFLALGYNTGGCFNGVRDFGPRLVAVMAGWGGHVFRDHDVWWIWGPWAAVITGGLCGGFAYDSLIFTGGESPVNYPPRRRKRAALIKEKNIRRKLRFRKGKIQDIEKAVQKTEE